MADQLFLDNQENTSTTTGSNKGTPPTTTGSTKENTSHYNRVNKGEHLALQQGQQGEHLALQQETHSLRHLQNVIPFLPYNHTQGGGLLMSY